MQEVRANFTIFKFVYFALIPVFCFHSMYTFFISQIGEWEKSLSTNDAESFGIFLILEKFICLLVYFFAFTMSPCVTSITLNALMIFSSKSGKLYYNFFKY